MLAADYKTVKDEIDAVLAESPQHTGALILRSDVHWNRDQDEKSALADLATVIDPKAGASSADRTQAFAKRGWIHAERGRAGDARGDFEQALKLDPRNVAALVGQGEVFYNEGRYTEALSRFETAVQTDKTDVLAVVADAKAKIALERLQDAKTQLSEARLAYARDPRVAYWLGKAEEALGNSNAAEHQYTSAIELSAVGDRDAILPYVALATSMLARGEAKDAQAKLDEARSKLPDSAALQRALGELAAAQGQYDDAVKYFEAAIERDAQDVSTRFRLGSTYRRMGKMDKATEQFDMVLASDKDYPGLALERGLLYEQSGDVEKALEQFKNALAKAPDDPDLQVRVGAAYVAIQRPDEAIPMLRKVLEKRSNSAEANHYLGRALFLKGQASEVEAMRYLRRAVELDPHRSEYHLYVGWAANSASPAQLGLARDEIDKALAQDQLLADGWWQLGVLERKEGAVENALKHLKKALDLKPTRFEVHASMAECYEDKNDSQTALAEWQKAITANDKVAVWRYRYGRLLFDRHQSNEAAKHLAFAADIAVKEDPKPGWYPNCEFLAAESLRASGNRNDAKDRYRKFLGIAPMNSPDRRDAIRALRDLGEEWGN
jgi:tetratricopeptide (TPR) repeat protein